MKTKSILFASIVTTLLLLSACDNGPITLGGGAPPTRTPTPIQEAAVPPSATSTNIPSPTLIATPDASSGVCNNSYWPIAEGAGWSYENTITKGTAYWTISEISPAPAGWNITFVVTGDFTETPGQGGVFKINRFCDTSGLYEVWSNGTENSYQLYLPEANNLTPGWSWIHDRYSWQLRVIGFERVAVPAGSYETVKISVDDGNGYATDTWYAAGIGPVKMQFFGRHHGFSLVLMNYSSPVNIRPSPADEANVRYILADIQLGGVIDYYREHTDEPAVAEAVRRWDAGGRVNNIDQFERKIVGDKGWQVVYRGTDTLVDGMDVRLTTDQ